jgi:serine protease Do
MWVRNSRRRIRMRTAYQSLIAVLVVHTLSVQLAAADEIGGPFADAIVQAQLRTVKLYGAAIGREPGYATGVVVSDDGLILTANGIHLLGERIRVTLPDGTLHDARLLRRSEKLQVALLTIDAPTPDYFQLSEKPAARQGDWVLSVSNAFKVADGREPLSVNLGVVSLRTKIDAKFGTQDVAYEGDVLLIDAITSNPGAPGGAVVTADGRLAGMIGKIIESKSTGTRLNYAVPADLLAKFVRGEPHTPAAPPVVARGKAVLGLRLFTLGGRRAPAYVDRVLTGSPAAQAGLKSDDLIVSVAGQVVHNVEDFDKIAETLQAGQEIVVVVKRKQQLVHLRVTPIGDGER